jgi:hypothetical protein
MGGSSSILSDTDVLSSIRLIKFDDFKSLGRFPRYPEDQSVTLTLDQITEEIYNTSLIVFVSHCWLRGWDGAEGWDGRPHPDNAEGGKYHLCTEGIEKVMKIMAPGMEDCYIWVDYGCINQDGNPCGELKQLDKIIQICDCIFTPIFDKDPNAWEFPKTIHNYYEDYKSSSWNGHAGSYLGRGWCRIEMFYAVNIPVLEDKEERRQKFANGLAFHRNAGRRPHILYGSKESLTKFRGAPKVLPPLQNSYFEQYHPEKGNLTKDSDRETISKLIEELKPFMKTAKEGYEGEKSPKDGAYHGKGKYTYANGDIYTGQFQAGKMTGRGRFVFANGHIYDGEWKLNKKDGKGKFFYANGNMYVGEFKENKRHGHGRYVYASGDVYEGDYRMDLMTGKGTYQYASTEDKYEGEFHHDLKQGQGKLTFKNGDYYEGEWKENKMNGKGVFYTVNTQNRFEGSYLNGKRHGKGKVVKADGTVEEGEWKDGVKVDHSTGGNDKLNQKRSTGAKKKKKKVVADSAVHTGEEGQEEEDEEGK